MDVKLGLTPETQAALTKLAEQLGVSLDKLYQAEVAQVQVQAQMNMYFDAISLGVVFIGLVLVIIAPYLLKRYDVAGLIVTLPPLTVVAIILSLIGWGITAHLFDAYVIFKTPEATAMKQIISMVK